MQPVLARRDPEPPREQKSVGLIAVRTLDDINHDDRKAEAEKQQVEPLITGLANKIRNDWEEARFAKRPIDDVIIDCMQRRSGEYSGTKLAAIRDKGGSEAYMMLTSIKCRAAEAWIDDVLFPSGDKPWAIKSTPIPDINPQMQQELAEYVSMEAQAWMQRNGQALPPEALQEAFTKMKDELTARIQEETDKITERMSDKIEDQLSEGNWESAMREVIKDVVTFPAGILKGPVIKRRPTLKWENKSGRYMPTIGHEFRPEYYRVAPHDAYPSASSKGINDGFFIERHRLRRSELIAMKGVPGYSDKAIDLVLTDYGLNGLREWLWNDQERARLEGRPNETIHSGDTIDALEYWGSASGKMLVDWGMDKDKIKDLNEEYSINAWLIGNHVIRAVLNDDPLGERPYWKASFDETPGSFWGQGVPYIMRDVQDVCNAAARSLINNMAIASGPLMEVHADRLPVGEDIESMEPWQIYQTTSDPHGTNNPAIRFHNPKSNAKELLAVFQHFSGLADEYTGIPKYSYGEQGKGQGAAGTASGLSMLMSSAARGIKMVIKNLDRPIEGSVRKTYYFNMLHDPDESIKGDLKVIARGSASMVAKEQQMIRRAEFLGATNNPIDNQIMGVEGRAALLRESVKSFDMPVDDVIPDKEALMEKMRQSMMAEMTPEAGQPGQALGPDGAPVAGQDAALFQQTA